MTDQPIDPDERMRRDANIAASVWARHADSRQAVIDYLFWHRNIGPWLRKQPDPQAAARKAVAWGEETLGPILCGYLRREAETGRQEEDDPHHRHRRPL